MCLYQASRREFLARLDQPRGTAQPSSATTASPIRFAVLMADPTAGPAQAALITHADSGQSQGTFFVDKHVIGDPIVQPNCPRCQKTGSYYPVWLTIGPRP